MARAPRKAVSVLFAVMAVGEKGATYRGLQSELGLASRSALRDAVLAAQEAGFIEVITTGPGRGGVSVVRLTVFGREILEGLGLWKR